MLDYKFDVDRGRDLSRAFVEFPGITVEELTKATWSSELLFEREAKENTPAGIGGGGGLRGSIAARQPAVSLQGIAGMVATPLNYAVPVELGTRPHMPPVQPLIDWAEHKLGVAPAMAKGIGFAIARKIAAKGTDGVHMFGRAVETVTNQVRRIYDGAVERILERIGGRA